MTRDEQIQLMSRALSGLVTLAEAAAEMHVAAQATAIAIASLVDGVDS